MSAGTKPTDNKRQQQSIIGYCMVADITRKTGIKLGIGSCEIFVKVPFLKAIKKLECLVLCGNDVDREILVSCETLKKWDIIHCTFGQETVTSYIIRCKMTRNLNNLTH